MQKMLKYKLTRSICFNRHENCCWLLILLLMLL